MDTSKSVIFALEFVKPILHTITHLIQYTVLEIQFWSVKCTAFTVRYAKVLSICITSHQAMQTIYMGLDHMKTNHFFAFKHIALHILIQIVKYIYYSITEK